MTRLTLLLALLLIKGQLVTSLPGIGDIQEYVNYANDLYGVLTGDLPLHTLLTGSTNIMIDRIGEAIEQVSEQLTEIAQLTEQKMDSVLSTILTNIPFQGKVDGTMRELHSYVTRVDSLYGHFEYYARNRSAFTQETLERFTDNVISHKGQDLPDAINRMYRLIVPGRASAFTDSVITLVSQQIKMNNFSGCNYGISPQLRIYQVYNTLMITESRGYTMTMFAYSFLTLLKNTTFPEEMDKARIQLIERADEYFRIAGNAMKGHDRKVELCAATNYKRGESFTDLLGTLQMIFIPERDLVETDDRCSKKCHDVVFTTQKRCPPYKHCPKNTRCHGSLFDCYTIDQVEACLNKDSATRRYRWANDANNDYYGPKNGKCFTNPPQILMSDGYWDDNGKELGCKVCNCTCSEERGDSKAIRTLSLIPQIADTANNMVVSAVRFIEKDRMIHLQIRQGKLLRNGKIDERTQQWLPIPTYEYVNDGSTGKFVIIKENGRREELPDDSYVFIRREQRTLHLDDINVAHDYTVTGVALEINKATSVGSSAVEKTKGYGLPLQLKVHATKIHVGEGKLFSNEWHWETVDTMLQAGKAPPEYKEKRTEVDMIDMENPVKASKNDISTEPNRKIRFQRSIFGDDIGQLTVPFFDIRPVQPRPILALSGVGIFHRGTEGYGGYLHIRLQNIDLTQYLSTEFSTKQISTDKKNGDDNNKTNNKKPSKRKDYDYDY